MRQMRGDTDIRGKHLDSIQKSNNMEIFRGKWQREKLFVKFLKV